MIFTHLSRVLAVLGLAYGALSLWWMPPVVAQPTPVEGEPGLPRPAFKQAPPRLTAGPLPLRVAPRAAIVPRPATSEYDGYDANTLQFGTGRWRDQMRRENRWGNPG
jgi:hypothetical protein